MQIRKIITYLLITILLMMPSTVWAKNDMTLITLESCSSNVELKGQPDLPIVIATPPRLQLSDNTEKLIVIPEKLDIKDEIQEFRMFRNRYVIFGVYLSLALYYNWLTRYR